MTGLKVVCLIKTNDGGRWLVPQVEELRRRGHQVTVVLPAGPGYLTTTLVERGFAVVASPFDFRFRPTPRTLRGLWQLRRLLRGLQPDVVKYHLYAAVLAGRIATVGMRLSRIQFVAGPLQMDSWIVRQIERIGWRLESAVVCGTRYTARRYAALGCPPQRLPVATCGADLTHYEPGTPGSSRREVRAKARADLGLDENAFVAVMVAFVYPPKRMTFRGRGIKGHDVLLQAWSAFRERHRDAHLLLVGGGWQAAGEAHRAELMSRFRVAADPSVTWVDSVTDVRPYYRAADVSVSPSLSEGHGAAAEASAMAVPSIVSDAGGLPETVTEASGWVVPRGDADALDRALELAYQEFATGRLARRNTHARAHAGRALDSAAAARQVADVVERSAVPSPGRAAFQRI